MKDKQGCLLLFQLTSHSHGAGPILMFWWPCRHGLKQAIVFCVISKQMELRRQYFHQLPLYVPLYVRFKNLQKFICFNFHSVCVCYHSCQLGGGERVNLTMIYKVRVFTSHLYAVSIAHSFCLISETVLQSSVEFWFGIYTGNRNNVQKRSTFQSERQTSWDNILNVCFNNAYGMSVFYSHEK